MPVHHDRRQSPDPEEKDWTYALVRTLRNWGGLLLVTGRGEEAWVRLTRAVEIMEAWAHEDPVNPFAQDLLIDCLVARMNNSTFLHRREEGEKDWQRAVALSARRNSWGDLCTGAARDVRFGAHALAAARAEHLAKQKGLTSADRFELAKAYAQAAQAVRKDSELSPTEQGQKAEGYAAAALALLERLGRDGYFKDAASVGRLKTDDDLKPLHQRPDYQKLLTTLEAALR